MPHQFNPPPPGLTLRDDVLPEHLDEERQEDIQMMNAEPIDSEGITPEQTFHERVTQAICAAERHRENRMPMPLHHSSADTRLTKWVRKASWTPRQGALLACGFDPDTYREKSYGQNIKGATGLCGGGFMGNHHFEDVERVLNTWRERLQCPEKVPPAEFIAWCEAEGIDTRWLTAEAAAAPADAPSASPAAHFEPVAVPTMAESVAKPNGGWWASVLPYMCKVLHDRKCSSAKELHRALEEAVSSPESPFEVVQRKLRVRGFNQTVAVKTIQNRWRKVRAAAGLM